jgi:hypothetical protein
MVWIASASPDFPSGKHQERTIELSIIRPAMLKT